MSLNKKEYNKLMNENWAGLLFNKDYKDLNPAGKKLVKKAIANDKEHNNKDKNKLIKQNPELYKKGKGGK